MSETKTQLELPSEGGSYNRMPDGSLQRRVQPHDDETPADAGGKRGRLKAVPPAADVQKLD